MKGRVTMGLGFATAALLSCANILGIGPVPDASDEGPASDAGDGGLETGLDAGPMCDPTAPFASVDPVPSLSGPNILAVTLSPDQTAAYVCTYDSASSRTALLLQDRESDGGYGPPLTLLDHGCAASVSADHRRFFYEYDNSPDGSPGNGDPKEFIVYQVTALDGGFFDLASGAPTGNGLSNTPFVLANDSALYLTNTQPSVSGIYRAVVPDFPSAVKLKNITQFATAPVVTPDDLVLHYSAGNELAVSVRASTNDDFPIGAPLLVTDAGGATIRAAFVSEDRCTVYYSLISKATQTFVGHRTP